MAHRDTNRFDEFWVLLTEQIASLKPSSKLIVIESLYEVFCTQFLNRGSFWEFWEMVREHVPEVKSSNMRSFVNCLQEVFPDFIINDLPLDKAVKTRSGWDEFTVEQQALTKPSYRQLMDISVMWTHTEGVEWRRAIGCPDHRLRIAYEVDQ